jgi:hypothetical protein
MILMIWGEDKIFGELSLMLLKVDVYLFLGFSIKKKIKEISYKFYI